MPWTSWTGWKPLPANSAQISTGCRGPAAQLHEHGFDLLGGSEIASFDLAQAGFDFLNLPGLDIQKGFDRPHDD